MNSSLRILLAIGPATLLRPVSATLRAAGGFEIAAELTQPRQAIEARARLRPDVLVIGGEHEQCLDTISRIMAAGPLPILLVGQPEARPLNRYEAIAAGVLEVLETPAAADEAWAETLVRIVTMIARVRVITHVAGHRTRASRAPADAGAGRSAHLPGGRHPRRLVALGASTGGPMALVKILSALPRDFPLPLVVVIHVGGEQGDSPAAWLKHHCPLAVATATDGEALARPGTGRVIIAPAGSHLLVQDGLLRLSDQPERHSCRPSIDVLFESVAAEFGAASIGCLLTGMGRDGADGLLAIRRAGGVTLAQDEQSSVVFGMPKAAIELGAAQTVLPLTEVAPALVALARAG